MRDRQNRFKHMDFIIIDAICLLVSFVMAYYLRHHNFELFSINLYKEMLVAILAIQLLLSFFIDPFKKVLVRGYVVELRQTLIFVLLNLSLFVVFIFATKNSDDYSRITLGLTYALYFVSSYITRIIWKKQLIKKSQNAVRSGNKSLLVVCKENEIDTAIKNIKNNNFDFYQISAICLVDRKKIKKTYKDIKIIDTKELLDYISTNWVDDILITYDYKKLSKTIIKGIKESCIPVHIKLNDIEFFNDKIQVVNKFGEYNVVSTSTNSYSNLQLFIKRIMDIVGGIIGCLITLVLIIVIGPIIYIKSPGPIIYVSNRVGKNGKLFKFYKFRSMVTNADELKKSLAKQNRLKDGMMFKVDNDPRIIPGIGQFIRKTSLDEFPQFFNVLKGDMSLVGTRPPTLDEWNKYSPYYRSRLSIKPGITGMWQVSGRSNIVDFDEVVRLDNDYINNWNIWLDIKILFKTVFDVISGKHNGAM